MKEFKFPDFDDKDLGMIIIAIVMIVSMLVDMNVVAEKIVSIGLGAIAGAMVGKSSNNNVA